MTLISTYVLFVFTDFVPLARTRYQTGFVLIGVTTIILFTNVIMLIT